MTEAVLYRLLGWTPSQWAEAVVYFDRCLGHRPHPTLGCALVVKKHWRGKRMDEPGDWKIVEVDRELDFQWAYLLMEDFWKCEANRVIRA